MKTLVIEREALRHNIGVIKERAGQAVIYAVLTGDGHGAGLVELARVLREEGIGRFAVSEPAEAAALRKAGFVEEELLMLRPTVDREELAQLIELDVVCTVGSSDTGRSATPIAPIRPGYGARITWRPVYSSMARSTALFSKVPPCTTIRSPRESRLERRTTFVNTFSMMDRHRPAIRSSAFLPLRCSVMMLLFINTVQRLPSFAA